MPIDEFRFRQALSHFATGVTVVTTIHEQNLYGMTVSSFSSLSLKPPLILFCVDSSISTYAAIIGSKRFAVNILEQHQEHLSRRFASRAPEKFVGVPWQPGQLGIPLIDDALAVIECQLHSTLPGGDHTIVIGEVQNVVVNQGAPLVYYRSGYHELA